MQQTDKSNMLSVASSNRTVWDKHNAIKGQCLSKLAYFIFLRPTSFIETRVRP